MSWTKVAATISAALLAGMAVSASAADEEYARSGPFVAASAAYSFQNFSGGAGSPDDAWGYQLDAGYRFNEWFSLQLDWEHSPSFNGSGGDDVEIWMIGLDGKIYPFHGMVQPFLLLGMGYASADESGSNNGGHGLGAKFGAGFDFYLARNWALTTETGYVLLTGNAGDYSFVPLSFGVVYRFF